MKTTGNENLHFTSVLTADVKKVGNKFSAVQLLPTLIYKNLKRYQKGNSLRNGCGGVRREDHDPEFHGEQVLPNDLEKMTERIF